MRVGRCRRTGVTVLVFILAASWVLPFAHAAAAPARPVDETRGILIQASCTEATCTTRILAVMMAAGPQRFLASAAATAVYVGNQRAALSSLDGFIGIGVSVLSQRLDSQQVAGRIDVFLFRIRLTIAPPVHETGNR